MLGLVFGQVNEERLKEEGGPESTWREEKPKSHTREEQK
jgi:hypothetical protein